ncbi:enoyl-CoA hydratase-related protein [Novosphingobium sp.]|uniref:enoyl-CoA hydratase-related protein n=1 Tax=Novosphingobium sp. TaxID=1874826 RepID=UPI003BAC0C09
MTPPALTQFCVELKDNGLIHLVFDCPGKSMNVFSNKAIHELGEFAEWLHRADVKGVLVRSGKATGFCAGADLTELGVAYDMIVAAPAADRFDIAFNHFFPLSHAIRRLETAGKPVAAAIAGVALGGGCELALGAHYRVITNNRRAMLGLPECAVGLLPGAGGTQRMPRLVGVGLGLEVLLLGRNLYGDEALEAGLVHAVVAEGEEVSAAENWLLSDRAHAVQPWDQPGAQPLAHAAYAEAIARHRTRELARMLGHEPAPLAILDCVEFGLMQPVDGAIRAEMSVFAHLIQRPEPRNMIRTMFLGKQAYDKAARDQSIPAAVEHAIRTACAIVDRHVEAAPVLKNAGFRPGAEALMPVQQRTVAGFWLESNARALDAIAALTRELAPVTGSLGAAELVLLDHGTVRSGAIPAYLGGITGLLAIRTQA